jgi:hypothetical protein
MNGKAIVRWLWLVVLVAELKLKSERLIIDLSRDLKDKDSAHWFSTFNTTAMNFLFLSPLII